MVVGDGLNAMTCFVRGIQDWSVDDVAWKWWQLCPARKNKDGSPAEPTEFELNEIRNDTDGIKEKRLRLSSVSWFMRFLSERIAKLANNRAISVSSARRAFA